jgi:hypothetical protein
MKSQITSGNVEGEENTLANVDFPYKREAYALLL